MQKQTYDFALCDAKKGKACNQLEIQDKLNTLVTGNR